MRRKNLFAFGVLRFANTPYNNGGYIYFGLEFYMDYRRAWHAGGTYFFTVNLLQRRDNDLLVKHIDILRGVVKKVKNPHPFIIHGWVVLPEHFHCVIELLPDDMDFALRLRLIKSGFSKAIPKTEYRSASVARNLR